MDLSIEDTASAPRLKNAELQDTLPAFDVFSSLLFSIGAYLFSYRHCTDVLVEDPLTGRLLSDPRYQDKLNLLPS